MYIHNYLYMDVCVIIYVWLHIHIYIYIYIDMHICWQARGEARFSIGEGGGLTPGEAAAPRQQPRRAIHPSIYQSICLAMYT